MNNTQTNQQAGAENLLLNCIGVKPGESIVFIKELEGINYYDEEAPNFVESVAKEMGVKVSSLRTSLLRGPEHITDVILQAINGADHTIFFSRVGDQIRFSTMTGGGSKTMCYALDIDYLGSEFCTVPQGLLDAILDRLEAEINDAKEWRISCPLGTDVVGEHSYQPPQPGTKAGFTLLNFPTGIFRPLSCETMNGRVVISHWLTPSGSHPYEPDHLVLEKPVTAIVKDGCISKFEGDADTVRLVEQHYERVSSQFGIDPDCVHSWHAGINGQTYYSDPPAENIWRWANLTFSSPRRLHFHTCGNYPPGEIAWSIFDQTVSFDSVAYWKDGRFVFLERDDMKALLHDYPTGSGAYQTRTDIGV